MRRWQYATDYAPGTLVGSQVDQSIYLSAFNHPSIIPQLVTTLVSLGDGATYTAAGAHLSNIYSKTVDAQIIGPQAVLTQEGDTVTIAAGTTVRLVTVRLAGIQEAGGEFAAGTVMDTAGHTPFTYSPITANAVRNGGKVAVLVDNVPQATIDVYNTAVTLQLFLDGAAHTIKLTHTGTYNTNVHPVSTPLNVTGTSIAPLTTVILPAIGAGNFDLRAFNYKLTALSSTTYRIDHAPQPATVGGALVYTPIVGTATANATVYSLDGGLSVFVNGTLVTGDVATFTSDYVMIGMTDFFTYTSAGVAGAGSFTSETIDSGEGDTQWFLGEWAENVGMASYSLATGNTPAPDASWSIYTVALPTHYALDTGETRGVAGLMAAARGRYAQWTVTFPVVSSVLPYARDFHLYYWVPERDPNVVDRIPLGRRATLGRTLNSWLGAHATQTADAQTALQDKIASHTIAGAVDQYLAQYGADLGQPAQYTAESPQSFRARILNAYRGRALSPSLSDICQDVALLVLGEQLVATVTKTGNLQTATCTSALGHGAVVANQLSSQQYALSIPPPVGASYPGMPGVPVPQAQVTIRTHIFSVLNPLGAIINPNNATLNGNIVFN